MRTVAVLSVLVCLLVHAEHGQALQSPSPGSLDAFLSTLSSGSDSHYLTDQASIDAFLKKNPGACVFRGMYGECSEFGTCSRARGFGIAAKHGAQGCPKSYCCIKPKCSHEGRSGRCSFQKSCDSESNDFVSDTKGCSRLGGTVIQCCVPKAKPAAASPLKPATASCEYRGRPGTCIKGDSCDPAQGYSWVTSRLGAKGCESFPGNVRCCVEPPTAKCQYENTPGLCLHEARCTSRQGKWVPSKHGATGCERMPTDVRCCVSKSTTIKDDSYKNDSPERQSFSAAVFEEMWRAFPPYPAKHNRLLCIPGAQSPVLKKTIGGRVDADWIRNTCAIRLSYTFNKVAEKFGKGWAIPKGLKCPRNLCEQNGVMNTISGLFPHGNYAYRVKELSHFLNLVLGRPTVSVTHEELMAIKNENDRYIYLRRKFRGRAGIIRFLVKWKNAVGHFDLWNGFARSGVFHDSKGRCAGNCYWRHTLNRYERSGESLLRVDLWEPSSPPSAQFDTAKCNKAPTYAAWKAARQQRSS